MDQADRIRKALRVADVSVQDIAEVVGINRNMVSAWINGRARPSDAQLAKIAMRTGAPKHWLRTGELNEESPSPDGGGLPLGVRAKGLEPPTSCSVVRMFHRRDGLGLAA